MGEALLAPHRSYFSPVWPLLEKDLVHGMAHITGGGIPGNLSRSIPDGLCAQINLCSWPLPPLFQLLSERTGATIDELYKTFNMGIGFILCVSAENAEDVLARVNTEEVPAWIIGEVVAGDEGGDRVRLVV